MSLSIAPIESESIWETFVTRHAPQSLFQSWSWGEVQKKLGVKVWRLGLYDTKRLVGVVSIYKVIAKRGTYLHIRHGPIFNKQDAQYWSALVSELKLYAKRESAWFIRVSPLIVPTESNEKLIRETGFLPSPMHAMDAELSWVLDITPNEDELLSAMRKTTRYEIRRALKEHVSVFKTDLSKDLPIFFKLYEATAQRQKFIGHRGIQEEFEQFASKGNALLFLGKLEGEIVSGAIILFYGNQAIYHHGASVRSKYPVSTLVQWEAIREAKKRGLKVYNFWGIAPNESENHPWRGITLFKKGFGGHEEGYMHAQDYPTSSLYVISKTIETARRKLKGYDS